MAQKSKSNFLAPNDPTTMPSANELVGDAKPETPKVVSHADNAETTDLQEATGVTWQTQEAYAIRESVRQFRNAAKGIAAEATKAAATLASAQAAYDTIQKALSVIPDTTPNAQVIRDALALTLGSADAETNLASAKSASEGLTDYSEGVGIASAIRADTHLSVVNALKALYAPFADKEVSPERFFGKLFKAVKFTSEVPGWLVKEQAWEDLFLDAERQTAGAQRRSLALCLPVTLAKADNPCMSKGYTMVLNRLSGATRPQQGLAPAIYQIVMGYTGPSQLTIPLGEGETAEVARALDHFKVLHLGSKTDKAAEMYSHVPDNVVEGKTLREAYAILSANVRPGTDQHKAEISYPHLLWKMFGGHQADGKDVDGKIARVTVPKLDQVASS